MVLLDLLHVQRAGFFKFLKSGIDKELSQLNLNVDNTRLQVVPFLSIAEASPQYAQHQVNDIRPNISVKDLTRSVKAGPASYTTKFSKGKPTGSPRSLASFPCSASEGGFPCTATEGNFACFPSAGKDAKHGKLPSVESSSYQITEQLIKTKKTQSVNKPKYLSKSFGVVKNLSTDKNCLNQNSYFRLIASKYTPREAILYQKSWSCKLVVKVLLTIHEKNEIKPKIYKGKTCQSAAKESLSLDSESNPNKRKGKPFLGALLPLGLGLVRGNQQLGLSFEQTSLRSDRLNRRSTNLSENEIQKRDHELFLVLGELPLMTRRGHFIIHGSPRVILSQLIRTPGIYFTQKNNELQADCVPEQGPWLCIYKSFNDDLVSLYEDKQIPQSGSSSSSTNYQQNSTSDIKLTSTGVCNQGAEPTSGWNKKVSIGNHRSKVVVEQALPATEGGFVCLPSLACEAKSPSDAEPPAVGKDTKQQIEAKQQVETLWNEPQIKTTLRSELSYARPNLLLRAKPDVGSALHPKVVLKKAKLFALPVAQHAQHTQHSREVDEPTAKHNPKEVQQVEIESLTNLKTTTNQKKEKASYFCYTKQFSSMPFSLIYSTFRVFELHSQFTDQTLLLTKLKTLEKIRKFKEVITTLLTFTWKKRVRRRLQRLYTKRCFTLTQQFEKTKVLFRLKNKLILGPLSRKSFNEKLGISSCVNTGINQNAFMSEFFDLAQLSGVKTTTISNQKNHRASSSGQPPYYGKAKPTTEGNAAQAAQQVDTNLLFVIGDHQQASTYGLARQNQQLPCFATEDNFPCSTSEGNFASFASFPADGKPPSVGKDVKLPYRGEVAKDVRQSQHLRALQSMHPKVLQVIVDQQSSLLPSDAKHVAKQESKWFNSTTLLSRDLALIALSLDGYKIMPEDDIDDLNNQRVRTSSDQIQQQVRVGLFRFKKMFVKLISSGNATSFARSQTITDFLNGALREFFGSNPLSQFLDQTNPLAEITHKRRISKLGLGGIQRESATLKVRTIHSTYFGRICPIETPEGLNAGLVNSLTCLSRVDQKGQLVTPVSLLIEKQKQEQFFYYSNKENTALSTTDTALLKFQRLPNQFIYTKNESQFQQLEAHKVKLRVKSDLQTISLATALIPFLAYDDANRALMGSNMQRQAVPLILPERPIVRTGMESLVINESGHSFQASLSGFVSYISAQHMVILCNTLNKRLLV